MHCGAAADECTDSGKGIHDYRQLPVNLPGVLEAGECGKSIYRNQEKASGRSQRKCVPQRKQQRHIKKTATKTNTAE